MINLGKAVGFSEAWVHKSGSGGQGDSFSSTEARGSMSLQKSSYGLHKYGGISRTHLIRGKILLTICVVSDTFLVQFP